MERESSSTDKDAGMGQPTCSPGTYSPGRHIVRIRPDQVTKRAFVRNLLCPCNYSDLIEGSDLWTQSPVDTEHFAVHYRPERHEVKYLTASFPYGRVPVFLQALLIESVYLRYLSRFMVPSHKGYSIRVSDYRHCQENKVPRSPREETK
jgi:hypothetical protein